MIQAQIFFSTQLVTDADIFLLRYILHDWPDAKAIKILKCLREAVIFEKTKVVVIDRIAKYACTFNLGEMPGAGDVVFEGSEKKSKVPAG